MHSKVNNLSIIPPPLHYIMQWMWCHLGRISVTRTPTASSKWHPTSRHIFEHSGSGFKKKKGVERVPYCGSLRYTQALHFPQQNDSYNHTINKKNSKRSLTAPLGNPWTQSYRHFTAKKVPHRRNKSVSSRISFFTRATALLFHPITAGWRFWKTSCIIVFTTSGSSLSVSPPLPSCPQKGGNRSTWPVSIP